MKFADRAEAGRKIADTLASRELPDPVVLGLPRGGVVVAAELANTLRAPLDLAIARKIGHPRSPEYAIGAVTEDGESFLNQAEAAKLSPAWLEAETAREVEEAKRRRKLYLGERAPIEVVGKTVILVDDGIATGFTLRAAIRSVRRKNPARIIVAAPVAPPESIHRLKSEGEADEVVVLYSPADFFAIGAYYEDFHPVSDQEVIVALQSVA
jgi:predicted phosphoribosyltransferase